MARRKPTSASARQKISQALRGKKKKKGISTATKKKAAAGLAVTGGLAAAALAAKNRKGKAPAGLLGAGPDPSATALVRQGMASGTQKESVGRMGKGLYSGGGTGRKESITGRTKRGGGKLGQFLRNKSPRRK